jgi:hypothetical protein
MQLFWVDMDRADSLSGGAGHPERQVLDYLKTNIHITSSGMLPERLLRHTLDFTSADRSPTIPATGPMPPRSGSSSRPSPTLRSMPRSPAATPRLYSAWPGRNRPPSHPQERPERHTRTTAGARPAGIQNAQICAQRKSRPHPPAAAPNGGTARGCWGARWPPSPQAPMTPGRGTPESAQSRGHSQRRMLSLAAKENCRRSGCAVRWLPRASA